MTNIIFWVVLNFLAGGIGSFFTIPAIPTWYAALNKPFFNPPNWIFGPVWTILYILTGIAMGIIANAKTKDNKTKKNCYLLFISQLALNSLWSILFFGLKTPLLALLEIMVLLSIIILTTISFYKIKKEAAYLMYPYIAWVSFASILNLSIVLLN